MSARRRGSVICLAIYAIALAAAAIAYRTAEAGILADWRRALPVGAIWQIAWPLFCADVVGTIVVFLGSRATDNSSVYDAYWSVAPIALVGTAIATGPVITARGLLVMALVCTWGSRLTYNWWRGWPGLHHEDWRYVALREKHGRLYWLVSLFGIHMFPTLLVFGGVLSAVAATRLTASIGVTDVVAIFVTCIAIGLETVADKQLHRFRQEKHPVEAILKTGVWGWLRHPNYAGEIMFWLGLWCFALQSDHALALAGGWLAIAVLFATISIPMIDARMRSRRPAYAAHMKAVNALVPRPPNRK